ncbi:histidine kinase [Actinokineospora auranticolor]|uniref:histidine kinase n=1 Tax=Actinokineospora auranticolor TaxID=155976 RepID=A0A2S6H1D3_9PSEU|nr:histidine kinase [Actinokineospora auranticolor]PPK71264.1 signal transduction histidine kinase [Actinokineospora auranticolor]
MIRTSLQALTLPPGRFLRSAWPSRSLIYLASSLVLGLLPAVGCLLVLGYDSLGPVAVASIGVVALVAAGVGLPRFDRVRRRLVDREPRTGPVTAREMVFALVSALVLSWLDVAVAVLAALVPSVLLTAPLNPGASLWMRFAGPFAGVVAIPLLAYAVTAWAGMRAAMGGSLDAELREVKRSRARLVDVFEVERRRIERDLHDGAQQRLVALTVSLGLARLDLEPGSVAAHRVEEAHRQAKEALVELRELIRGVHPKVLSDRGLAAAVAEAADRSPVPVDVELDLPRLPEAVEVAAYFVVSEALANVAKHSRATRCWITGELRGGVLTLRVGDNGVGAADPAGGGLTGLADRVAVVDGRLALSSPPGGPTVLRVEMPCP